MKLRLLKRERELLGQIGLYGDLSIPALAKLTGQHVHNVRYSIERLEEAKILKRAWVVDIFKLGWQRTQILFACKKYEAEEIRDYFINRVNVVHLAEIGGEYDYDLLLLTKTPRETLDLMREANAKFPSLFANKKIAVQTSVGYFNRKYLSTKSPPKLSIEVGTSHAQYEISDMEQRLLSLLMEDSQITNKELASELGVSQPTILSKLKKLKEEGVIVGSMFTARFEIFGVHNYKVLIHLNNFQKGFRDRFFNFFSNSPHCTSYREFVGEWDCEVSIEVENYKDIIELRKTLHKKFENEIVKIEIIPRFKLYHFKAFPVYKDSYSK